MTILELMGFIYYNVNYMHERFTSLTKLREFSCSYYPIIIVIISIPCNLKEKTISCDIALNHFRSQEKFQGTKFDWTPRTIIYICVIIYIYVYKIAQCYVCNSIFYIKLPILQPHKMKNVCT